MKITWTYDQRDNHEVELGDPDTLEALLREIQQAGEPVVMTIFSDSSGDLDDLPPGIQIGLDHPTHAFAVHIVDDGDYLNDPAAETPAAGLRFDVGGVPTEYPAEHLQLRPETAIQLAVAFLRTGGELPRLAATVARIDREGDLPISRKTQLRSDGACARIELWTCLLRHV